jgi:hypothetical protein
MVLPSFPVASDYFETIGIPLLRGRTFAPDDGPNTIVVNDRLARAFWGDASPLGRRFRLDADDPWRTVVGVVGDVRTLGLDDPTGHGMEFYTPRPRGQAVRFAIVLVRSPLPTGLVVQRVKELLWTIDASIPVSEASSMRDALLDSLSRRQFVLKLSAAFTVIALLLGGTGIYAVAAYWVAQRRRDLAIRVALGATGRQIARLVYSRAATVAAAGAALGATGAAVL